MYGKTHDTSSYVANDPSNARGAIHGVPLNFTDDLIRAELRIQGRKLISFRRLGQSKTFLLIVEGPPHYQSTPSCAPVSSVSI